MKAFAIGLAAFLAGTIGGTSCALYFSRFVYERGLEEFEEYQAVFGPEILRDVEGDVRDHYFPLRSYAQGNLRGLIQFHCYVMGMKLRNLRPATFPDPQGRARVEQLKSDASALLQKLQRDGTCLAPGGVDMRSDRKDD